MIHYILQVLIFQLLFLLVYDLFLKKETFFNYNRLYLLVSPVIAFVIPWLRIELLVSAVPQNARLVIPQALTNNPDIYVQDLPLVVINAEGGWTPNWWLIIYLAGVSVSLGLFIYKSIYLKKLSKIGKSSNEDGLKIISVPNSKIAYTFFNSVYLGEDLTDLEKKQILSHELVHVRQKHSYDLVFFEILKVIFWFNPLVYIYQSRIAGLHEFIADSEAVKTVTKKTYFEQLLNTAFNTKDISFTNQFFNHSLIKKRIIMLQKNKSKTVSKFKFLIIIPLMLAMLTYVACSESNEAETESSNLSEYNYTLTKGEKMSSENHETHNKYEEFLFNNPDYVSWATIEANTISYSVHPADEKVPFGYRKLEVGSPDGNNSYVMYMNLPAPDKAQQEKVQKFYNEALKDMGDGEGIAYAEIDKVPAFENCSDLEGEERKTCTSREISMFVNRNFDTSLGKELGLTGINRVIVQFRIDKTGKVRDIKSRAPHPKLQEEAERVIASLPDFIPGEQNGKAVSVMYSLPIAFKVAD